MTSNPPEKKNEFDNKRAIKAFSERARKNNDNGWGGKGMDGIPATIGYIVMKEKFDKMYRHIERLTL
jgi:hypothetical protein